MKDLTKIKLSFDTDKEEEMKVTENNLNFARSLYGMIFHFHTQNYLQISNDCQLTNGNLHIIVNTNCFIKWKEKGLWTFLYFSTKTQIYYFVEFIYLIDITRY